MKIVISGSSKIAGKIEKWRKYWQEKMSADVLCFAEPIPKKVFTKKYPYVCQNFFENITKTDILFVANEKKGDIEGYIGSGVFAEIIFAIMQNKIYNKKIKIILAKIPSKKCSCYDEIKSFLKNGDLEILK